VPMYLLQEKAKGGRVWSLFRGSSQGAGPKDTPEHQIVASGGYEDIEGRGETKTGSETAHFLGEIVEERFIRYVEQEE